MGEKDRAYGVQITALFRNMMNAAGIDWKQCVEYGEKFNEQIAAANWVEIDDGTTFEKYKPIKW